MRFSNGALGFHALVTALLILPLSAQAQRSPFRGEIRASRSVGQLVAAHRSRRPHHTLVEAIDPILITARIPTQGVVWFRFDRKWLPRRNATFESAFTSVRDSSDPILLRGSVVMRDRSGRNRGRIRRPVTASFIESAPGRYAIAKIQFLGSSRGRTEARPIDIEAVLAGGVLGRGLSVRAPSRFSSEGRRCGTMTEAARLAHSLAPAASAPSAGPVQISALRIVQISTETDFDWFLDYGSSSNAEIMTILNAVETIYESQLNLTFDVVRQNALNSAVRYTTTNADDLLEEFRDYTNAFDHLGNADVYHLFSGKNLFFVDGGTANFSVIGLAYFGVVCAFPSSSYGLTENTSRSLNIVTTAHELGHNFGANHTSSGIMTDTLDENNPPGSFSAFSVAEISSHVQSNSGCLAQGGSPTPPPGGTATPRPTSTPGRGGGGGGSGGGIDPDPEPDPDLPVLLQAALTKSGNVAVQVNLLTTSPSCSVAILAADKQSKVMSGALVGEFAADFLETRFDLVLPRKTLKFNRKGRRVKVFLVGRWSCAGSDPVFSATKGLNPSVISSRKKALSAPQWIKALRNGLASATPVRE